MTTCSAVHSFYRLGDSHGHCNTSKWYLVFYLGRKQVRCCCYVTSCKTSYTPPALLLLIVHVASVHSLVPRVMPIIFYTTVPPFHDVKLSRIISLGLPLSLPLQLIVGKTMYSFPLLKSCRQRGRKCYNGAWVVDISKNSGNLLNISIANNNQQPTKGSVNCCVPKEICN